MNYFKAFSEVTINNPPYFLQSIHILITKIKTKLNIWIFKIYFVLLSASKSRTFIWMSRIMRLKKIKIIYMFLYRMAIIGLFQSYPWCLPRQNWLHVAINEISIQEFSNVMPRYNSLFLLWILYASIFQLMKEEFNFWCKLYW